MSENRKALKIISIIIILAGLYDLIPGLIILFTSSSPDIAGQVLLIKGAVYTEAMAAVVFGAIYVVSGLINLIVGLLGWRGAKNPSKIGPFFVLAVIASIVAVLLLVSDLATGTWPVSSAIEALLVIATAVIAYRIRQEA